MAPTVHLRRGIAKQLRAMLECATDGELAEKLGMDPSQLSRVYNRKSGTGPTFIARTLIAAQGKATFEELFEVVDDSGPALRRAS